MYYQSNMKRDKKTRVAVGNSIADVQANSALLTYLKAKDLLMDFLANEDFSTPTNGNYYLETFLSHQLHKPKCDYVDYEGNKYALVYYPDSDILRTFKILPEIYDDETFKWAEDKATGTFQATLVYGIFEFICIRQPDGKGTISVRYAKCETKHKNRVTLELIEIPEAVSNEVFLDAIQQWKVAIQNDLRVVA